MPLHPLLPWQLKKKTAMARRCTSPRFSCSPPLLLQYAAVSPFLSPSAMAVSRRILVFATFSSSTHSCVPFVSPLPWWHFVAASPSTMKKKKKKGLLCHSSRRISFCDGKEKEHQKCCQNSLPLSELSSNRHIWKEEKDLSHSPEEGDTTP
ncbi:hypothetical protein Ahy_B01g053454 isoform D [Arachis hypogaea]|uniref:Uncharacterized protein n=1 Tax=Arachis hypogaea TaxID=3818 RepID=A0A445ART9_ARAHY|nr:hypothetical protein Ahy_B01g053454 isoform D [Arachis hypogaea]